MHLQVKLQWCILAALCCIISITTTRAAAPPQITLRKCCPYNEDLLIKEHTDRDSIQEYVECIPSHANTSWIPPIKLKKRQGFFTPDGGKPKHITFEANKLPLDACSEPMHTVGANSAILVMDGSLIVVDRNLVIPQTDRFCIDRQSAIYCMPESTTTINSIVPDQAEARVDIQGATGTGGLAVENPSQVMAKWQRRRTTVRKCCGQGSAYSSIDKTCVRLQSPTNPLNSKPVFDASLLRKTRLDLLYGFPTSCQHKNFAILGTFKQELFDEEQNVLKLENSERELKDIEFCLEHMFTQENDTVYSSFVTVFTCAELFPSSNQPEQNEIPRVRIDYDRDHARIGGRDVYLIDFFRPQDYRYVVYAVGLIISLIFLIATLVISFLVPSNHHALHWRCQTYYVGCLLVGDFFLAITQLSGHSILEPYCSIIGKWIKISR